MADDEPEEQTEVETKDKAEEAKTESAIIYKKETRERKSYGVSRVQVMPGLAADYSTSYDEEINYTPFVPTLSEDIFIYIPMTYVFRIPQFNVKKKVKNLNAKSPPFHILFDHCVAVMWVLLSDGSFECPMGISQLQWAYNFLKTIRLSNGLHSDDTRIMLQTISELLRKAYAMLSPELNTIENANKNINYYDVFGTVEDIEKKPISVSYEEMKKRGDDVITVNRATAEPPLSEEELRQKIDQLIEDMEDFEHLEQERREKLIKDFIKYKDQIQKRCEEQMETLLAIQSIMKEVSPELFPEDPPNPCKMEEEN
ncbi:unnamed protein product [Brassicogethes aeneus]|uniref:Uncharacterized protein n=1 Tax=Brassicogethes aeneus TaxID=1431903 RepID=A0A9P0BBG1_BRAAE|nr:unnamed protein product [Brassicogethes aeneus]